MANTDFNVGAGVKAPRKLLKHYVNVGTGETKEWELLGVGIEDSSIETNFAYVDHIVFNKINDYPTDYQAITNEYISLDNLTKEQRKKFVPDILVINKNNVRITINQPEL